MNCVFQGVSENVLNAYMEDYKIILATVDKSRFLVTRNFSCGPEAIVNILRCKLEKQMRERIISKRSSSGIGLRDINIMIEKGEVKWVL